MGDALARACAAAGASLRHDARPGDIGEMVRMHGLLYAKEHGFTIGFETYVAGTFAAYEWPLSARQRVWIIEKDGAMQGTVAIVSGSETKAQLRWLLLSPGLRGRGLGKLLVDEAVAFSRECGYSGVLLWTVGSLAAATTLYRRAGFVRTEEKTHPLWGAVRTEERYDFSFA